MSDRNKLQAYPVMWSSTLSLLATFILEAKPLLNSAMLLKCTS